MISLCCHFIHVCENWKNNQTLYQTPAIMAPCSPHCKAATSHKACHGVNMQWMETGAAGLPGVRAMLLIGDQEPESVITLRHSEEDKAVVARISKKKTVQSQ